MDLLWLLLFGPWTWLRHPMGHVPHAYEMPYRTWIL